MIDKRTQTLPLIALTMGEAAGVGPELLVRLSQKAFEARLLVLADAELLSEMANRINVSLKITSVDTVDSVAPHQAGHLFVENHSLQTRAVAGKLDPKNAVTTLSILARASELALNRQVDAIVTAPVHKANLNQLDPDFIGHTEYFAKRADVDKVVMMLAANGLRIALATTHLPLREVPNAITRSNLKQVIDVILSWADKFAQVPLRLAVCGLNPHAGESGLLGSEEQQIIQPLVADYHGRRHSVSGPYPADTLFTPQKRKEFDLFLAMYHDQGLPVVKASGFGRCVNVTLGLPYVRTSVDHGTALDIAASYSASSDSLTFAVNYAAQLVAGILPQ